MKYLFWVTTLFFVFNFANASGEHHERHHVSPVNGIDGTNGTDGTNGMNGVNGSNGLNGVNSIGSMPSVPYQFNPDSTKYQLSIGASTKSFNGNNAIGIAFGKRLCDSECKSSFWHGGITTDGNETGANAGVTFSWD